MQFRGVNKHAQNEYVWNAVSDEDLRREWQSMADLGVNLVRLPHYPHSRLEYDIADERGIAVWAENGYAGQIWKDPGNEGKDRDARRRAPDPRDGAAKLEPSQHPFLERGQRNHSGRGQPLRRRDPAGSRSHAPDYLRRQRQDPQNCDFVADNTYDGWYTSGPYTDFARLPRNGMVSETGAGDWITHHVPYGTIKWSVDKYEPEEYSEMFAEYRLQTVCRNDAKSRPMFLWWNFREFYNLKFKSNRNTKGLLTLAGMPKDTYFLFQAFLNPARPVVHLCGRHHFLRAFAPDNGIKVYSNAGELQLTLNGVPQEKIKNGSYRIPDSEMKKNNGTLRRCPASRWQTCSSGKRR